MSGKFLDPGSQCKTHAPVDMHDGFKSSVYHAYPLHISLLCSRLSPTRFPALFLQFTFIVGPKVLFESFRKQNDGRGVSWRPFFAMHYFVATRANRRHPQAADRQLDMVAQNSRTGNPSLDSLELSNLAAAALPRGPGCFAALLQQDPLCCSKI
jgi:hypothetical protein